MASNREGWHYLAVKELSALLREIISQNNGAFYCLYCLPSFWTEDKLVSREKVCKNKDLCNIAISSEDTKMLEFNQ